MTVKARQIVLASHPKGMPSEDDLPMKTVTLDEPGAGEVLLRVIYLSLDPYMRGRMTGQDSYAKATPIGETVTAESICEVVASRDDSLAEGDIVRARTGWVDHAVLPASDCVKVDSSIAPISTALGVMGMPGFTAYSGLLLHGRPKEGETVCVSSAAGAVGQLVGQIAKIKGARVVGIAGGERKCALVRDDYGFDACVDYKADDFSERLKEACPDGIDVYFENVGGPVLFTVLPLMNEFSRIPICGMIAWYNLTAPPEGPDRTPLIWRTLLTRKITARGFINYDHIEHWHDFERDMAGWIASGEVRYREDVVDGLENAVSAFQGLLRGDNDGKLLIRVGDDRAR